ncbi:MAG TPA: hypothetical protein VGR14_15445, partial [Verrucomicrobiae bacterium]|nr:hypothetical protein [Verrucomicrobiae bacterium]
MKPRLFSVRSVVCPAYLLCVFCAQASSVSTNKSFMLGTNNALPPDVTNFFSVNSNLLNASVNSSGGGGGGGGGSGVSSVNGLTGAITGVLTNGETPAVTLSNSLTLNSNLSGPGWSIVTNGPATATFASFGPNGGYGLYGSAGWTNYALFPSVITLTGNGLTGNIAASGSITAASFAGGGASLTGLSASQLTSGTVPVARLPLGSASAVGAVSVDGTTIAANSSGQLSVIGGEGGGSVISVSMTGDNTIFNSTVSGSPITASGTLTPTLKNQSANTILAGPPTGSAAAPTFQTEPTFDGVNIFDIQAVLAINGADSGMIGDGSTDNTAAFSNMWQTCFNQGGGFMYVGPGTYVVSKTFHVPTNGTMSSASCPEMTLICAGIGVTLFSYDITPGTNDAAWLDTRPVGTVNLSGFTVQNAATTGSASTLPDIFDGGTVTHIDNVEFRTDGGPGRTNVVYGGTSGDNETQGVQMGFGGYGSSLTHCIHWDAGAAAILNSAANDIVISDCYVKSTQNCYAVYWVYGPDAANNKFTDDIIEMSSGNPVGVVITNNSFGTICKGMDFDDASSPSTQIGVLNGADCLYTSIEFGNSCDGQGTVYKDLSGGRYAAFESTLNGGAQLENTFCPALQVFGQPSNTNDTFEFYSNGVPTIRFLSSGQINAPAFSGNGALITGLSASHLPTDGITTVANGSYLSATGVGISSNAV